MKFDFKNGFYATFPPVAFPFQKCTFIHVTRKGFKIIAPSKFQKFWVNTPTPLKHYTMIINKFVLTKKGTLQMGICLPGC